VNLWNLRNEKKAFPAADCAEFSGLSWWAQTRHKFMIEKPKICGRL
jgi:hypothetical protein